MRNFFLFTLVIATLMSCSSKPKFELEVNINDNISLTGKKIAVCQKIDGVIVYSDTTEIKKNSFTLGIPYKGAALLYVSIPESDIFEIMMAAEEGKVQLDIDGVKAKIGGTPLNDRLQTFYNGSDSVSLIFKQLEKEFELENQAIPQNAKERDEADKRYLDYREKRNQLLIKNTDRIVAFIKENIDNPIGEYYFINNYILLPREIQLEMDKFISEKLKRDYSSQ